MDGVESETKPDISAPPQPPAGWGDRSAAPQQPLRLGSQRTDFKVYLDEDVLFRDQLLSCIEVGD